MICKIKKLVNVVEGTDSNDVVNKKQMDDLLALKASNSRLTNAMRQITYRVQKAGDTMSGNLNMGNNRITNSSPGIHNKDVITLEQLHECFITANRGPPEMGYVNIFKKNQSTTSQSINLEHVLTSGYLTLMIATTSTVGQKPPVAWSPSTNTFINEIELQMGSMTSDLFILTLKKQSETITLFYSLIGRTGTFTIQINHLVTANGFEMFANIVNLSGVNHIPIKIFTDKLDVKTTAVQKMVIDAPTFEVSTEIDMKNHKITNVANPNANSDAINKSYLESKTPQGVRDNYSNFDCQQKVLFNNKINSTNADIVKLKWVNDRFLKLSGGQLSGNLNLNGNTLYNLPDPNGDKQPTPKKWIVDNYLNKSTGVMAGPLNMSNNKITHLATPTDNSDAVNKSYVDNNLSQSHITPSHYKNEFTFAMQTNKWTEEAGALDTFDITKVGDLQPHEGNYHTYNHKVLFLTIKKNVQGGYNWEMGLKMFTLDANKDYTMCLELLIGDYQLWHKANATVNTVGSTGVSVSHHDVKKFSQRYTNNSGSVEYMYYIRMIINFQKTGSNPHILKIHVGINQSGIDLNIYPSNWTKTWIIVYGVFGKFNNIDSDKVYDYHTAFDIKPTEVVYNVDLDMNRKKKLNIAPDKTKNNSAATVKMVKDLKAKLSPHTTNNAYRKIFEEFYDFGDASNYQIVKGPSGIVVTAILPNITFPRIGIDQIYWNGGLSYQFCLRREALFQALLQAVFH